MEPPTIGAQGSCHGLGLGALVRVAREHGYSLVAVAPPFDAFFVRNDLIDDGLDAIAPPLEHWRSATCLRVHPPVWDESRIGWFVDYDVWRETGGDTEGARRAAEAACRRHLRAGAWAFWLQRLLALALRA